MNSRRKASDAFLTRHFGSPDSKEAEKFDVLASIAVISGLGLQLPELFAESDGPLSPFTLAAEDLVRAKKLATNQAEFEKLLTEGTVSPVPHH